MKTHLIFVAIILLSLTTCKKDKHINGPGTQPEQLPPATQEGKNTFGCLVNGQVWLPQAPFPANKLESSYQNGVFLLKARKYVDNATHDWEVVNYSGYFFLPGEYDFTGWPHDIQFRKLFGSYVQFFRTDSNHTGKVNITKLDTMAGIIAGTFYFDAIDTTTNEVVHITEGRFDVKFAN